MMGQGQCTHMASGGLENMPIDHSLGLPSRRVICSCLQVSVCGVVALLYLENAVPFAVRPHRNLCPLRACNKELLLVVPFGFALTVVTGLQHEHR